MAKPPGFKKLKVPGPNELRPNQRDSMPEKGALSHVKPVQMVYDLGAPRDSLVDWRGVQSPASATFKAGKPLGINASQKPEPQSLPIHTGRTWPNRDKKSLPEK